MSEVIYGSSDRHFKIAFYVAMVFWGNPTVLMASPKDMLVGEGSAVQKSEARAEAREDDDRKAAQEVDANVDKDLDDGRR